MATSESSYDLLNVSGPLTVETILRTLQHRFNDGHCYVSRPVVYPIKITIIVQPIYIIVCLDMDGTSVVVCESI